jgi:hypothetical protein
MLGVHIAAQKAVYVAYHGCFVQICFLSKLKLFSMHYKFYDSFIIIFSSNGFSSLLLGYKSFRWLDV